MEETATIKDKPPEPQTIIGRITGNLNRLILGALLLLVIGLGIWFIPDGFLDANNIDPKMAILSTLLISGFKVIEGFMIGHLMRKSLLFYINFGEEKEWSNNVLVIVFYILGVWGTVTAG